MQCIVNLDTGEATDDLQPQVIKMFQQLGSNCTTVSQVIESEDKAVFKAIQDGIDRYNTHHLISNAQRVNTSVCCVCVCVCIRVYVHSCVCVCAFVCACTSRQAGRQIGAHGRTGT